MPPELSLDFVESETTNSNLERGRLLYQGGFVSDLKILGKNLVVANVKGNKIYRVFLEYKNDNFNAFCNCLYEPKGNCKHLVAVKYSLLDLINKKNWDEAKKNKISFHLTLFHLFQKQKYKFVNRMKKGNL